MCGRTACTLAPDAVVKSCTYKDKQGKNRQPVWVDPPDGKQYKTGYNLAPGTHTPVLLSSTHLKSISEEAFSSVEESSRVIMPMKWGLTPPWHKGDPYKVPYETNNCRAEGMLDKKTYKVPLQHGNRCVILADGFFEWKSDKDGKQPYFFYFPKESIKPQSLQKKRFHDIMPSLKEECAEFDLHENLGDERGNREIHLSKKIKSETSSEQSFVKVETAEPKNVDFWDKELWKTKDLSESTNSNTYVESNFIHDHCSKSRETKVLGCGIDKDGIWDVGNKLLTMAGVFDVWKNEKDESFLYSYSIITVSSSSDMDWCHHRMPAILSTDEEVEMWLDSSTVPLAKAVSIIKPKVCLTHHAVSRAVNNSRYQAPDCIKPLDISSKPVVHTAESKLMQNWLKSSLVKRKPEENIEKKTEPVSAKMSKNLVSTKKAKKSNLMLWLESSRKT